MYVQETVGHRCRLLPSTRGEAPVRSRENFRSTTSVGDVRAGKGSRTARLWTQIADGLGPLSCPHLAKRHLEVFWTYAPECGTGGRSQIVSRFESRTWNWRRRPDLNRGSRFCSLKKGLDRRQRNARKLPCSKAIGLSHELAGVWPKLPAISSCQGQFGDTVQAVLVTASSFTADQTIATHSESRRRFSTH
jgi:hypothetical protein